MKLEKIKKTYNDYKLELSWGQIEAIAKALASNHSDPVGDELNAEWQWYMERVPGPGEDEDAWEAQQKAREEAAGGGVAPEGEEDMPIPMPPGSKGAAPADDHEGVGVPSDEEMAAAGEQAEPEGLRKLKGEIPPNAGLPEPEPEESAPAEAPPESDYALAEPPAE